jgi:ubiquinone/menaquinone biosynthesis C-methylase UbiE
MTQNTDDAWESWAQLDPYFSVLTDPRFRSSVMTDQARSDFFASGYAHVNQVMGVCRSRLIANFQPQRILDFGCGVGRLLIPFAEMAQEVVGIDISSTMLEQARQHCAERQLTNVVLAPSDDGLSAVEGNFDLVHTCIVLQHLEIPRGRQIFGELVRRIRPGGCGAIHVTFAWDIHADSFGQVPKPQLEAPPEDLSSAFRKWVRQGLKPFSGGRRGALPKADAIPADPEMQMNFYNLSELFFCLQQSAVSSVHTEITNHGGAMGAFLYFAVPEQHGAGT